MTSPIETQVNELGSKVENLDSALMVFGDRLDLFDGGNALLKSFEIAELDSTAHTDMAVKIGDRASSKINTTAVVNYPTGIKIISPGVAAIISYYQRLVLYTSDFAVDRIYPHTYQNPTANNEGIAYSFGFDIDSSNGDFAICSYARHICRVYQADGTLKFTIGMPATAGGVDDGLLQNPRRPMFLPNGNILILSYSGRGEGSTNHGHISEYSGTDGSLIKTHMGFYGDGQSTIGTNVVYRPMDWDIDKSDPNLIWISEFTRGRILLVDMTTWTIQDIYYPPEGYSFINSYGIASLSDGNIAIASNIQMSIMIVDRATKGVIEELDVTKVGASPDFRDVKEIEPGFLLFTSWAGRSAFIIPRSNTVEIEYSQPELPEEASLVLDAQFPGYDAETKILTRRINDLDDVPEKITVPYTKSL